MKIIQIHNHTCTPNLHKKVNLTNTTFMQPCADIISFSGRLPQFFINDIREIPDLNCACCDVKMKRNSEINNFIDRNLYFPIEKALKVIKQEGYFNENSAPENYKIAYQYLTKFANMYPNLTITDLLSKKNIAEQRNKFPQPIADAFNDLREIAKLPAHNAKYIVKEIDRLHPTFHKTEKKIYKALKKLAHKYPQETFHDILNKPDVYKYYLNKLEQKQSIVFNKIKIIIKDASPELKTKVNKLIKTSKDELFNNNNPSNHKRTNIINNFYRELKNEKIDIDKVKEILQEIEFLPSSKTDIEAFMVTSARISSNAIIEKLLNRIRNTNEHVKPHKRINDNGPNSIYNYIGLCGKCNGDRQRTEYNVFIDEKHPEMPRYAQKQVNTVIKYINAGILRGHDIYPAKIKEALKIESKGKIKIDIKKLDLTQARANRQTRQNEYIEMLKNRRIDT